MKSTGRRQFVVSKAKPLEQIPGVGKAISQDLWNIGIRSVDDLKGRSAEQLYDRLCKFKAQPLTNVCFTSFAVPFITLQILNTIPDF